MPETADRIYFDATLTPNRSLSPRAFLIVIVIIGVVSFVAGLSFLSMGAFPVLGFFGLDALAIWFAFRLSFRQLQQRTRIQVTARSIQLLHEQAGQPDRYATIPTAFAHVAMAYPARRPSELSIAHSGTAWVLGRFLTPSERATLMRALQAAVQRANRERYLI